MPDSTISRRFRWSVWIAVTFLLLFMVLAATPLLMTTRLANLALGHFLPDNRARIVNASLSLTGTLILRNVVIFDSGVRSQQPLAAAGEIDVRFGWRDLFARRVGSIRADEVMLYARSDDHSQLSLIDLAYELWRPSSVPRASPFWIGAMEIHGRIRQEHLIPGTEAQSDLQMALQMIMSGDRARPSRHLTIAIGNSRPGREQDTAKGSPAIGQRARNDSSFGMVADIDIQSLAEGTRVVIHRLSAAHAALTLDANTLRAFIATLPSEIHGQIETRLENLSALGTVDLSPPAKRDHLAGSVAFSGLRTRIAGDPKMTFSVDDLAGAARVESNLQPLIGTSITFERLQAQNAKASIEADTLRHFVTAVPSEMHGRIDSDLAKFSASGAIDLPPPTKRDHLVGSISFSGLSMRVSGDPKTTVRVDDLTGTGGIASDLPLTKDIVVTIKRLHAGRADASIDGDRLRRYVPKVPALSKGSIVAGFDALDVVGAIRPGKRNALGFAGSLALRDFGMRSSPGDQQFVLDRLTTHANASLRLDRWEPATLSVRGGTTQLAEFSFSGNAIKNVEGAWHTDGAMLTFDRLSAQIFGGEISGAPHVDLAAQELQGLDLRIKSVDAHQALANISPAHLDAEGVVSGTLHMVSGGETNLSGYADLSFDRPGVLRIGQIDELQRMLAGSFGADMANLAMHDLERYPFREGTLHLESAGLNSELKIHFVREIRTDADRTAPRKEIINGKEVWVGSLVVPKVDLTIPIAGKSFAEILSLVSGFHPLIESVGKQSGK
jgi:hypothetical protein